MNLPNNIITDIKNNDHIQTRIKYLAEILLILVSVLCEYIKFPINTNQTPKISTGSSNLLIMNKTNNIPLSQVKCKNKYKKLKVYLKNQYLNLLDIYSKKNFFIKINFGSDLSIEQITADEKKFKQILYNIASNAIIHY